MLLGGMEAPLKGQGFQPSGNAQHVGPHRVSNRGIQELLPTVCLEKTKGSPWFSLKGERGITQLQCTLRGSLLQPSEEHTVRGQTQTGSPSVRLSNLTV